MLQEVKHCTKILVYHFSCGLFKNAFWNTRKQAIQLILQNAYSF